MEWSDEAILLLARPHGEGSLLLSLLTRGHGRHKGLVRGARRGRLRGLYEPGSRALARWNARLAEHLGQLRLEPVDNVAAFLLDDPLRLACLDSSVALAEASLPERVPHAAVFRALDLVLDRLAAEDGYAAEALRYELVLLAELGFGLDLAACAVTGATEDLAYVSPRSGRAVSRAAGEPYRDRLLMLPALLGGSAADGDAVADLLQAYRLTGYFLERHVFPPGGGAAMPAARGRYLDRLQRLGGGSVPE